MWFLVSDPNPLFFFLFFFVFTFSSFFLFYLRKSLNSRPERHQEEDLSRNGDDPSLVPRSLSKLIEETEFKGETESARSLLLDIFSGGGGGGEPGRGTGEGDGSGGGRARKKKKKRARKKRSALKEGSGDCERGEKGGEEEQEDKDKADSGRPKPELVCLYPFTSTSSATQRKIKQQYDQLVKCNETKGLTLAQVGEFANCLIEAKNELQQKSEVIKRKFTIAKALLLKADRSSIDRVRQQIFKLELEQKRLEEDAFVYNWLQRQLKLSPAYKKMVEISSCRELKAKSDVLIEHNDPEFSDISFEELLEQEKKDSFWQKNAKLRSHSS